MPRARCCVVESVRLDQPRRGALLLALSGLLFAIMGVLALVGVAHGAFGSGAEGMIGAVHRMMFAVFECDFEVEAGVAGERSFAD